MNTTKRFRFLGTTDEVTTCDCCGRAELKSTVGLEDEDGSIVHYGVVCAARAMGVAAKDVRTGSRRADDEKRDAMAAARNAADRAEYAVFQEWLDTVAAPKGERFLQLQALGGHAVARAMYDKKETI